MQGEHIARQIASRLFQIKRGFVRFLVGSVDEEFFSRRESSNASESLKLGEFEKTVGAAYDLRSRYVHVGVPFGDWVSNSFPGRLEEIQLGKPVLSDEDLAKLIHRASTLLGLERIMR